MFLLPDHGVFTGADMVAGLYVPKLGIFRTFGEISTISYSKHRELYPVRGLGTINPKGFTRGPRTIAGSLVFTVFDRHVLYEIQEDLMRVYREKLEANGYGRGGRFSNVRFVTDEMPPFDIIVSMANETNPIGSSIRIYGVRITNEGQTMSIEDMITENVMQYLATGIDLMAPSFDGYKGGNPKANYNFNISEYDIMPVISVFSEWGGNATATVVNRDSTERNVGPWKATIAYEGESENWITLLTHPSGFGSGKISYQVDPLPQGLANRQARINLNTPGSSLLIQQGVDYPDKY
jgi:hypothetical protein